jgi:class 3 adenylate cyclase
MIAVRIGLNAGEVVAGGAMLARRSRRARAVSVAARLEGAGRWGTAR